MIDDLHSQTLVKFAQMAASQEFHRAIDQFVAGRKGMLIGEVLTKIVMNPPPLLKEWFENCPNIELSVRGHEQKDPSPIDMMKLSQESLAMRQAIGASPPMLAFPPLPKGKRKRVMWAPGFEPRTLPKTAKKKAPKKAAKEKPKTKKRK